MTGKTVSVEFDEAEAEKLRGILRRMGEFIAYFEVAERKMGEWKKDVQATLLTHQESIAAQVDDIRLATDDLRKIMTEAGFARWHIAAEDALKMGKQHLQSLDDLSQKQQKAIQESNEQFARLAKKSFERLDKAVAFTIKNISDAISSFRISDFQKLTDSACQSIESSAKNTISHFKKLTKWFHWKNLALAAAITLVSSVVICLYLDDELPWEAHKQVAMQRTAGQALINAWPSLSQNEQQRIIDHSKRAII